MIFIGLDQATVVTGYSVYKNQELIAYGKFSAEGDDFSRYSKQKANVLALIEYTKEKYPKEEIKIMFEDIQMQQNKTTFKQLAQLQGALAVGVLEAHPEIHFDFIYASQWKGFAKIKGKNRIEQKRNAQAKVLEIFDITATQDEADAIMIGYYASHQEVNWN